MDFQEAYTIADYIHKTTEGHKIWISKGTKLKVIKLSEKDSDDYGAVFGYVSFCISRRVFEFAEITHNDIGSALHTLSFEKACEPIVEQFNV